MPPRRRSDQARRRRLGRRADNRRGRDGGRGRGGAPARWVAIHARGSASTRAAAQAGVDLIFLAFAEFGDASLPRRERLLLPVRVWADAERPADMVQDDRRLRKGARQIRQFHKLKVVQPSLEGQVQRRQPSKPGPPCRISHLALRRVRAAAREHLAGVPDHRMADARKRPRVRREAHPKRN